MDALLAPVAELLGPAWLPVWTLVKIVAIVLPLLICVAYLTYAERKVIGWMQVRMGPNRVGFFGFSLWGLGQPIADAVKLMLKEIIVPSQSNSVLFLLAPVMTIMPRRSPPGPWCRSVPNSRWPTSMPACCSSWPSPRWASTASILAGWASNSKYAFLGAMRSSAQMFLRDRHGLCAGGRADGVGQPEPGGRSSRHSRRRAFCQWYWLPLLPMFVVYFVSGVAETNRHAVRRGRRRVGDRRRTTSSTRAWPSPFSSWPNTPT
jgi:NADH-quinone oxidoreductase subunit H